MITETLWLGHLTFPALLFQTQLLKLYFLTTLYVDVKEPAPRPEPQVEIVQKLGFCGSSTRSFRPSA